MVLHFLMDAGGAGLSDAGGETAAPTEARVGELVAITGAEAHHAAVVRRVRVGEEVTVGDGRGLWLTGDVEEAAPRRVAVRVT
ncbi:RNA methyltransferase PUA domain-containing protein, partial [Microbacterium sp.]|uniref:RNA methyltransferase PUA domain-containing protein n=1 Tax=Microbacterium sp. TaxID=51671 RepID=UPI003C711057